MVMKRVNVSTFHNQVKSDTVAVHKKKKEKSKRLNEPHYMFIYIRINLTLLEFFSPLVLFSHKSWN